MRRGFAGCSTMMLVSGISAEHGAWEVWLKWCGAPSVGYVASFLLCGFIEGVLSILGVFETLLWNSVEGNGYGIANYKAVDLNRVG